MIDVRRSRLRCQLAIARRADDQRVSVQRDIHLASLGGDVRLAVPLGRAAHKDQGKSVCSGGDGIATDTNVGPKTVLFNSLASQLALQDPLALFPDVGVQAARIACR